MEVVCPSGFAGEVRGLKVKETTFFTDAKLLRTGKLMETVCRSCWVRTTNPGWYSVVPGGDGTSVPWNKMLHADLLCVFKAIRSATYGAELEWEVTCTVETCRHKFLWYVDLDTVPMKPAAPELKAFCTNGALFTESVNGVTIKWRPLLAGDDIRLNDMKTKYDMSFLTAAYLARIVEIENILPQDVRGMMEWIEDLDASAMEALQEKMDAYEPSLDLSTTVVCPRCENEMASAVPLFLAFMRRKKEKKK